MKRSLQFIILLLIPCICFLSCKKKAKYNWEWRVLSIDCESMVAKCGNGPGLRFNSEKFGVDSTGDYEWIPFHYTICCENVPEFIDKMKHADSSRRAWKRDKTTMDANYTVEGKTEIRVYYSKEEEYSFMWFGHPTEAPVISIRLDEFDKLIKDIEERFRTCCLE